MYLLYWCLTHRCLSLSQLSLGVGIPAYPPCAGGHLRHIRHSGIPEFRKPGSVDMIPRQVDGDMIPASRYDSGRARFPAPSILVPICRCLVCLAPGSSGWVSRRRPGSPAGAPGPVSCPVFPEFFSCPLGHCILLIGCRNKNRKRLAGCK